MLCVRRFPGPSRCCLCGAACFVPAMDATGEFEDIGHSESAREQMKGMLVGTFDGKFASSSGGSSGTDPKPSGDGGSSVNMFIQLAIILLAIGFFVFKDQILGNGDSAQ